MGFEAGSFSRQQITDHASKLAANSISQIVESLRGNICSIMLDGWTNNITGVHHMCSGLRFSQYILLVQCGLQRQIGGLIDGETNSAGFDR